MGSGTPADQSVWSDPRIVQDFLATMDQRERERSEQLAFVAHLLPFERDDPFTLLDLGAGTGAAARALLSYFTRARAVLADFSPAMMAAGADAMRPFEGRFQYVPFDMLRSAWPAEIPTPLQAVVTSQCVHHLPDERKASLFREIFDRLAPGGWYVNYDFVKAAPEVETAWRRVAGREDPEAARPAERTPEQERRWHEHIRYMGELALQLAALRAAGFQAVDVYWKRLDQVIYGGARL